MLTASHDDGWKTGQIAALMRLATDAEARPQDRSWAKARLAGARLGYDTFGLAVKRLAAENPRLRAKLKAFVLEIFSAS